MFMHKIYNNIKQFINIDPEYDFIYYYRLIYT